MQPETRILVVDDNSNTRALFRAILAKNGFAVAEAKEGQEALEQIHEFTPNVVLLDIMMPGVAGNELVETIKEWHPEMEVIMITSIDQEEIKQECLEKGAFDLLVKPVTQEQLLSTIHRALEKAA
jgi:CheY-like chemotaxis protein